MSFSDISLNKLLITNIVGIADKSFINIDSPVYDEKLQYNVISPLYIQALNPDIVLSTALKYCVIEEYFNKVLFKKIGYRFKYATLLDETFEQKLIKEWIHFKF